MKKLLGVLVLSAFVLNLANHQVEQALAVGTPVVTVEAPRVYRAQVIYVVDGDTLDLLVELGFDLQLRTRVRVYGVDTPETKGRTRVKGLEAKAFVERVVLKGSILMEPLMNHDKYGRTLAKIQYWDELGVWHDLSQELLKAGLAKEYYGGTKE
jgi:micrococcal nuclease